MLSIRQNSATFFSQRGRTCSTFHDMTWEDNGRRDGWQVQGRGIGVLRRACIALVCVASVTGVMARGASSVLVVPATESGNPMGVVASKVQQIFSALWNNPFERPVVEGIDVDIEVSPDVHTYFIESLQYDRKAIEPGGVLRVQAVLKPWRGEKVRRQLELRLPHGAEVGSTLRVAVGSPTQIERALGNPLARRLTTSEDLAGVLRVLGEMKAENRLIAVLYDDSPTVVRDGLAFSGLPATAAHLLATGARSGAASHSRVSRLATTQIELDGPVGGGLTIGVMVAGGDSSEDPKEFRDMKAPE